MEKLLNLDAIKASMESAGLSASKLSKELGVSRESTSKWLSGKAFPRPDKLLRLALALDLRLDDLVIKTADSSDPVIAFRKRANRKTTDEHISRATDMGRMLSALVPYLPYNLLVQPAILKNPVTDYVYIQKIASKIRAEVGVTADSELAFHHLIKKFNDLQAVVVPVLWGKKDRHENALHIYLPDSMTTWVYLNLDVEVHDFKFWMAHELSHVYTPQLRGEMAEDFADALAAALIFPEVLAANAYRDVSRCRSEGSRIAKIRYYAERYAISLITVYYEINKYAEHNGLSKIEIGNNLFAANTNFNKQFKTISQTLFDDELPSAKDYIQKSVEVFDTPFFDALKQYLITQNKTAGYVQSILDTPLLDAKGIHAELA